MTPLYTVHSTRPQSKWRFTVATLRRVIVWDRDSEWRKVCGKAGGEGEGRGGQGAGQ